MKKRILALILAALFAFTAIGCTINGDAPTGLFDGIDTSDWPEWIERIELPESFELRREICDGQRYICNEQYQRLREFARNINSGTTYYHEVIITLVQYHGSHIDPPNYSIWFSSVSEHQDVVEEMLAFAGLSRRYVRLESQPGAVSGYAGMFAPDYLLVNAELRELGEQWDRLDVFASYMSPIRSVRRGIVMDIVISGFSPAGRGNRIFRRSDGTISERNTPFKVTFTYEHHLDNEALIGAILDFTGIDRDNIRFCGGGGQFPFAIGWTPTRWDISPEQLAMLERLEEYMAKVNAPFWEDRHSNDPVIVRIGLPYPPEWAEPYRGGRVREYFTIWLYDEYLDGLTEEVAAFTGIGSRLLYFRVAEN